MKIIIRMIKLIWSLQELLKLFKRQIYRLNKKTFKILFLKINQVKIIIRVWNTNLWKLKIKN
jgi:hypothetical protein